MNPMTDGRQCGARVKDAQRSATQCQRERRSEHLRLREFGNVIVNVFFDTLANVGVRR